MKNQPSYKPQQYFEAQADDPITANGTKGSDELKPGQHFSDSEFVVQTQDCERQLIEAVDKYIEVELKQVAKPPSKLARIAIASLLVLVLVQTSVSLLEAYSQNTWLFGFYAFVLAVVMTWALRGAFREYRKLTQLKQVENNQTIALRLAQSVQTGEADKFINGLCQHYAHSSATEQYFASVSQEHNDAEKLIVFEQVVLSERDTMAKKIVSRYAAESAVLLAASPLAMLDMAIILWRNQRMITAIARAYGIELGYWSRIKLIKSIVVNIIYAGSTEVIADLGTQMMSMEMTGKLSARVAQGLGGGLLTARLGYQAMRLCRPMAFTDANRPKLRKIYQELLSELKQFTTQAMTNNTPKEKSSQQSLK